MEPPPESVLESIKNIWPAAVPAVAAIIAVAVKFKPIIAWMPKLYALLSTLVTGPAKIIQTQEIILKRLDAQEAKALESQEGVLKRLTEQDAKISENLTTVIKRLDNQDEKLKELVHNGGSSLKDAVVGISNQISILDKKCNVLFESSGKAVYECDKNGDCIWINKALANLYGMDQSSVLKKGWLACVHPDDVEKTVEHFNYCLKNKTPYRARYRIIRDEQVINVETTAIISKNAKDEVTGVVGEVRIIE